MLNKLLGPITAKYYGTPQLVRHTQTVFVFKPHNLFQRAEPITYYRGQWSNKYVPITTLPPREEDTERYKEWLWLEECTRLLQETYPDGLPPITKEEEDAEQKDEELFIKENKV